MYPGHHAQTRPDHPAIISEPSGEIVTYRELDERSNQLAQLWHAHGMRRGDHVCVFMENHPRYFEVVWAALRSGLYLTTVNSYLTASEVGYILADSGARVVVTSPKKAAILVGALREAPGVDLAMCVDGGSPGLVD
jgi:acyl-CoA synthetase (AMP-forming)/AMP-acid ligase II